MTAICLRPNCPASKKEDIHLDLEGDILTIRAEHTEEKEDKDEKRQYVRRERRYGSFSRSFDVSGTKPDPDQCVL